MKEKFKRSLVKTFSWRITGTLDTIVVSYFITGDINTAAAIGVVEVFTKLLLYFLHERIWNRIKYGKEPSNNIEYHI
ncbi:MAG: DUF2061 domain-containing protein [Melioribacteraceae bacterium]|nr:DUF2061 domain-containing protein [Melioribacteraceae bacterium]